jgi:uncharacterized protein YdhG (YjbR/CyaY superfamily)
MKNATSPARDIDDYISRFPPDVQVILEKIREIIRKLMPTASEAIKYGIPTFVLDGNVVHFAAFKQHIGMYPPVRGDAKLKKDLAPYANEKGNLSFPLKEPMPYPLIRRVVKQLVKNAEERAKKKRKSRVR